MPKNRPNSGLRAQMQQRRAVGKERKNNNIVKV
jgi:hypothetical protein